MASPEASGFNTEINDDQDLMPLLRDRKMCQSVIKRSEVVIAKNERELGDPSISEDRRRWLKDDVKRQKREIKIHSDFYTSFLSFPLNFPLTPPPTPFVTPLVPPSTPSPSPTPSSTPPPHHAGDTATPQPPQNSSEKHLEDYRRILKEKLSLKIRLIRLIHLGLPRSGKTTTQLRLFDDIVDMVTARIEKNQPSTGMAEMYQVIIGLIEKEKWYVTKDPLKEASLLNELFNHATMSDTMSATSSELDFCVLSHSSTSSSSVEGESAHSYANPSRWCRFRKKFTNFMKVISRGQHSPEVDSNQYASTNIIQEGKHSNDIDSNERHSLGLLTKETIQKKFSDFKKAISNENWEEAKLLLDDTIILLNTDTGGQTEFLEMLAPLVLGPSLYLLYLRLTDQLDKEYPVWITNEEGIDTDKEDSTITVEDFLFQALASIACFRNPDDDEACSKPVDEDTLSRYATVSKKSKVMFVGTYKDEVSDQELKEKDELLQGKVRNTDYFNKDIIEFASEGQLILDVNNFDGGVEDRNKARNALKKVVDGSFAKVELPAAWLMLSLYVRMEGPRTMTLAKFEEVAKELEIDPKELQVALWFFHRIMGMFLYYPELEELKDIVICDVKVIFDSITELVKNTFVFDKVGQRAAERFRDTAQFSSEDLEKAIKKNMKKSTSDECLIPLEKLVKLLEHLNILTTLTPTFENSSTSSSSKDVAYFMPSILRSAKPSELSVQQSPSHPASLMIRYECGYIPLGVFSCMVTNLISQIEKKLIDWVLIDKLMKKNMFVFRVGTGDEITLISCPKFIKVVFTKCSSTPSLSEPPRVRSVIESTLQKVTSNMNYHYNLKSNFAFECPDHLGEDVLCTLTVTSEKRYSMTCSVRNHYVPLQWKHRVWFSVTLESVMTFLRDEGFKVIHAEHLGKCLDIPYSKIEELKRSSDDCKILLHGIVHCWLNNDFDPSWNFLAIALDKCSKQIQGLVESRKDVDHDGGVPRNVSDVSCDILNTIDDSQLGIPEIADDLGDILDVLSDLAGQWRTIATNLRLRDGSMNTIETNYSKSATRCLQLAISDWLKLNYNHDRNGLPSWRTLAKAVRTVDGKTYDKIVCEHKKKERI